MNDIKQTIVSLFYRLITNKRFIFDEKNINHLNSVFRDEKILFRPNYQKVIAKDKNRYFFAFLQKSRQIKHNLSYFENVRFIAETGIVLKDNQIVLNTILDSLGYITKSGIIKHLAPFLFNKKYKKKSGIYFHLSGNLTYNFFHFLVDSLPRIIDFIELKKDYPNLKLLVNHQRSFTLPYLILCGINKQDIFFANQDLYISNLFIANNKFDRAKIDNLWAFHVYSKDYLDQLVKLLIKKVGKNTNQKNRRIYISRADVGTRIIRNGQEVILMLKNYGFEIVLLSELKVENQLKIISESECIVGAHGAGFANLIFASQCKVIELFPFNRQVETLYQMHQIAQLNNNYHILIEVNESDDSQNVIVNIDELEKVINENLDNNNWNGFNE